MARETIEPTAGVDHQSGRCRLRLHRDLIVIERCFRSLKRTQVKMTPMRRIEAHVKICVLALIIARIAKISCGKPWHTIRRALDKLQATKFLI